MRTRRYIPATLLAKRVFIGLEMNGTGCRRRIHPQNPFIVRFNQSAIGFFTVRDIYRALRRSDRARGTGGCWAGGRGGEHENQSEADDRECGAVKAGSLFHGKLSPLAGVGRFTLNGLQVGLPEDCNSLAHAAE
jgi:hypothetical protein